jgi:hypothetical protein
MCTQHDKKTYDFDGRLMNFMGPRTVGTAPFLSAEPVPFYVPLNQRRPSNPYRLGMAMVRAFTNMVFGEFRFPKFSIPDDDDTQDFVNEIVRLTKLPAVMIKARNIGGSTGSVGLSWCYYKGEPRVSVHNPKNIVIHTWVDRDKLIPCHVTEIQLFERDDYDNTKQRVVRNLYWARRDWTLDVDLVYKHKLFVSGQEPNWEVDEDRSVVHNDGICHFVWIQNTSSETYEMDGLPDYHGQYEALDEVDTLHSIISKGTKSNMDPTLIIKGDVDMYNRIGGLKKGSDNALMLGLQGDARYMEMSGSGINVALQVFERNRQSILETSQCVITDPNILAAQGVSSVALKAMYSSMLGQCDVLRECYGTALSKLLGDMIKVAQQMVERSQGEVVFSFPKRVIEDPIYDLTTGEEKEVIKRFINRTPGQGSIIEPEWGPYFMPTPDDQIKVVQGVATATGNKPTISQETGSNIVSTIFGVKGNQEYKRVLEMQKKEREMQANMFGDQSGYVGGQVQEDGELPFGASPRPRTGDDFVDESDPDLLEG